LDDVGGDAGEVAAGGPVCWTFNSLADFTQVIATNSNCITIVVNGYVALNQPWNPRTNMLIQGMTKRNSSFMYRGGAFIADPLNPCFTSTPRIQSTWEIYSSVHRARGLPASFTDNHGGGQADAHGRVDTGL